MKNAWVILLDEFREDSLGRVVYTTVIKGVYSSKKKAREGFEKYLREDWEDLIEYEDERDLDCHGDIDACVKDMLFSNSCCRLRVEVINVNGNWEGPTFEGY